MRDAFINELVQLAEEDPTVFLVIGDLGFGVVEEFAERFPDRFLNAGVAEQTMIGVASGLAASGYKVFCYSIANFPTARCLEQIRNDVCYHGRNVTIVSVGSGLAYGILGYTHHAVEDMSFLRALPGMRVMSPSDPEEARALTRYVVEQPGPAYLRIGKNGEPNMHEKPLVVDSTDTLYRLRSGADVAILSTGSILPEAVAAADALSERGIDTQVISVPFVKPLPSSLAREVSGVKLVVTVEEHTVVGGFGSAVLEQFARDGVRTPVELIGLGEEKSGIGNQNYLRASAGIDAASIADRVEGALSRRLSATA